jgi:ABC-2 type transport system ATP-binding protein
MPQVQITITDLVKRYGKSSALKGLSLSSGSAWKVMGIVGRNGAGKTTLLRSLVGLLQYDSGSIEVVQSHHQAPERTLGPRAAVFVAEDQTLLKYLSCREYLNVFEALNGLIHVGVQHDLRQWLLEEMCLTAHLSKAVGRLSKGMRRKLELVAALSSDVPIVVADEIVEGLDVPSMYTVAVVLKKLTNEQGKQYIISSHDISFISDTCDVIAVIDGGLCVDRFAAAADTMNVKERVLATFQKTDTIPHDVHDG